MFKKKTVTRTTVSDLSIDYIKKYAISYFNISTPINENMFDMIFEQACDFELLMIDDNGCDKTYDYPDKERNEMADKFVSDISGIYANGNVDLEDLNKRSGLI